MLRDKFREFSRDTSSIGQERVDGVNGLADTLIAAGHSENATVAEWKDGLNEAWADLLELIDTRSQMLAASYELHRFYHDARETLAQVQHKQKQLPDEVGRDLNTAEAMQRMHTAYEHDIQALSTQVSRSARRGWRGTARTGTAARHATRRHDVKRRGAARCGMARRCGAARHSAAQRGAAWGGTAQRSSAWPWRGAAQPPLRAARRCARCRRTRRGWRRRTPGRRRPTSAGTSRR